MAENKDNQIFTKPEQQTIQNVEESLRRLDFQNNGVEKAFREIIQIFEEIRSKVITQLNRDDFATMSIEIDLTQATPEVRLHYTTEAQNPIFRGFNRLIRKPKNTRVLILTKSGYRIETPDTVHTRRFRSGLTQQLREASYTRSSYRAIYDLIGKMRARLQLPRERL